MKRLLALLFILIPVLALATDVNFSLKDGRYGTANFANRTIWLQYLSAPTSYQGSPALYSKIITNTDVNGSVTVGTVLPGLWSCAVQAPPDSSTFYFVVLSDSLGLINAGDAMVLKTSNQYVWANSVNKITSNNGSVTINPTNGLGVVDLSTTSGGGSATNLTPWTTDINGAQHSLTNAANVLANSFSGNGSNLTSITAANIVGTVASAAVAASLSTPATLANLTGVTGSNVTINASTVNGLSFAMLPSANKYTFDIFSGILRLTNSVFNDWAQWNGGLTIGNGSSSLVNLWGAGGTGPGNIDFTGIITGNGAGLTNLPLNSVTAFGVVPPGNTSVPGAIWSLDASLNPKWIFTTPGSPAFSTITSGENDAFVARVGTGANLYYTNGGIIIALIASNVTASAVTGGGVGGQLALNTLGTNPPFNLAYMQVTGNSIKFTDDAGAWTNLQGPNVVGTLTNPLANTSLSLSVDPTARQLSRGATVMADWSGGNFLIPATLQITNVIIYEGTTIPVTMRTLYGQTTDLIRIVNTNNTGYLLTVNSNGVLYVDGSQITNLNAGNLASGTVPNGVLGSGYLLTNLTAKGNGNFALQLYDGWSESNLTTGAWSYMTNGCLTMTNPTAAASPSIVLCSGLMTIYNGTNLTTGSNSLWTGWVTVNGTFTNGGPAYFSNNVTALPGAQFNGNGAGLSNVVSGIATYAGYAGTVTNTTLTNGLNSSGPVTTAVQFNGNAAGLSNVLSSYGLTYYVSPTLGSSANSGLSPDAPWTLPYAITNVGPSNQIRLLDGQYAGPPTGFPWALQNSYVSIVAQNKFRAQITNAPSLVFDVLSSTYAVNGIEIGGILFTNAGSEPILLNSGSNFWVHDCIIQNTRAGVHDGSQSASGIVGIGLLNSTFERIVSEYNGTNSTVVGANHGFYLEGTNVTIRECISRYNQGYGYQIFNSTLSTRGLLMYADVGYRNMGDANGVTELLIDPKDATSLNNYVINCTFITTNKFAIQLQSSGNAGFTNNIITSSGTNGFWNSGSVSEGYNLCNIGLNGASTDVTNANIGLVSTNTGLYWLLPSSPARGIANTTTYGAVDFFGRPQASVADSGAFQYAVALQSDNRILDPSPVVGVLNGPDYWFYPNQTVNVPESNIQTNFVGFGVTNNLGQSVGNGMVATNDGRPITLTGPVNVGILNVTNNITNQVLTASQPVVTDGNKALTSSADISAFALSKVGTNDGRPLTLTGPVNIGILTVTNGLTNANLTASRVVLSDANKALTSAAASGAVPIDADGSATTIGQLQNLGVAATNDQRALTFGGNVFVSSLTTTNGITNQTLTASRVMVSGASKQDSSLAAAPADGWMLTQTSSAPVFSINGGALTNVSNTIATNTAVGATINTANGGFLTNLMATQLYGGIWSFEMTADGIDPSQVGTSMTYLTNTPSLNSTNTQGAGPAFTAWGSSVSASNQVMFRFKLPYDYDTGKVNFSLGITGGTNNSNHKVIVAAVAAAVINTALPAFTVVTNNLPVQTTAWQQSLRLTGLTIAGSPTPRQDCYALLAIDAGSAGSTFTNNVLLLSVSVDGTKTNAIQGSLTLP